MPLWTACADTTIVGHVGTWEVDGWLSAWADDAWVAAGLALALWLAILAATRAARLASTWLFASTSFSLKVG